MADPVPQDDTLSPVLQQVHDAYQTDEGKDVAGDVLTDIQQHANATAIVDANAAAGQQFVNNLATVKSNLVGMVQDDPTSHQLALGLAPKLVGSVLASTGMDPDAGTDAHGQITSHVQTEIAHAAITRMADLHGDLAHGLIGTLSPYLNEGDDKVLGSYVDTMQAARTADTAAAVRQATVDQQRASGVAAFHFGSSLLDPRTEGVVYPQDYLQSLVRNNTINPDDKQALFTAFGKLSSAGDVAASNPNTVRQALSAIADPNVPVEHGDIMDHVGSNLRYVDAVMLHGMNLQRTPDGIAAVGQLKGLLDRAHDTIAPSDTPAGTAAYSRFVNWLLPSYRRTGAAGLNPTSDNYLFNGMSLDNFRPTHEDAVAPLAFAGQGVGAYLPEGKPPLATEGGELRPGVSSAPDVSGDMEMLRFRRGHPDENEIQPNGLGPQRPSLGEIFAGNTPELDEKMRRLENLRNENAQPIAPASGNFFQRKLAEQTKNG
jgi:hypothetical protein